MPLLRLILCFVVLVLLNACYFAKSELLPHSQPTTVAAVTPNDSVAIMLATDGTYGGKIYQGSGRLVASRIKQSLIGKVKNAPIVESAALENALVYCKKENIPFLIKPSVLHWEDRATNWSALPDIIKIELTLLNSENHAVINTILFNASSSWWTFVNNPPEDMLDETFDEAVRRVLFRRD